MLRLWAFALVLAAPAASAGPADFRPHWGILADMAGRDYFYAKRGYAYSALRIEWIRPGEELRMVDVFSKKHIRDCRLVRSPGSNALAGTCQLGDAKPSRVEAEVDAEGTVMVASITKDFLFGDQRQKWGRFRPGKTTGSFELRVAGIESRALLPVTDPAVKIAPYARWLPEALASVERAAPATPAPGERPAAPVSVDQPPI